MSPYLGFVDEDNKPLLFPSSTATAFIPKTNGQVVRKRVQRIKFLPHRQESKAPQKEPMDDPGEFTSMSTPIPDVKPALLLRGRSPVLHNRDAITSKINDASAAGSASGLGVEGSNCVADASTGDLGLSTFVANLGNGDREEQNAFPSSCPGELTNSIPPSHIDTRTLMSLKERRLKKYNLFHKLLDKDRWDEKSFRLARETYYYRLRAQNKEEEDDSGEQRIGY